jgi:hypothetical protein
MAPTRLDAVAQSGSGGDDRRFDGKGSSWLRQSQVAS